ncbi:MAG: hypothetical protein NTV06_09550, partial [candidate division Zixibacteria bacterium]|nr:hypothetical protein [candidate division Zixibacteria bacterium]
MIEKALIAFLAILVCLLSALIIIRWRRTRGSILLNEEAINELVMAIVSNIRAGKIQDIAGRVSSILSRFLECDKIIFLRYHKTYLELNYNFGIEQLKQEEFRIRLTAELQVRLKSFHRISSINELESLLSSDYLGRLKQLGLSYFFHVYLRENFYGLYFIQTRLLPENPTLQFLATALAFNLSAAYHIGIQEQQLKKYEDRVKN